MTYKAIIFDMDGTIVDTEKIWKKANQVLLERRGIVYTPELEALFTRMIHGLAIHKSCADIKELVNLPESVEELIHEKQRIAQEYYTQGIGFIEGFEKFHAQISSFNIPVALATNATDITLQTTDKVLNLRRFFGEHLYAISQVNFVCKPHPAIYLHAADKLQIEPRDCIAIEDSAHGVTAALRAGMYCIGINTSRNRDQVKDAHEIIDCYREIDIAGLLGCVPEPTEKKAEKNNQ